jgi:hypothetical protein
MSLEILQQSRLVSEAIAILDQQRKALVLLAGQLGQHGHACMFAAAHTAIGGQFLESIQRAMATDVALAEQAMDEARAQARTGVRVPVAGGVLQVGSWS